MLEIKKYGEPILRKKAKPVGKIDPEILKLIDYMIQAMRQNQGVGVAANQIGIDLRIAVVDAGNGLKILINPEIIKARGKSVKDEGCLSFPGIYFKIARPEIVEMKTLNKKGEEVILKAQGLEARAFCHEIDHLNGKLIIDHLSFWQKLKFKKGRLSNR